MFSLLLFGVIASTCFGQSCLSITPLILCAKSTSFSKKAKRLVKQIQEQQTKDVEVTTKKVAQKDSSNLTLRKKQQNVYMALQKQQGIERLAMHLLSDINDYSTCEERAIKLFQKVTKQILHNVSNQMQFQAVSRDMEGMLPLYEGSCLWISVIFIENGLQLADLKKEVEEWTREDEKKKPRKMSETNSISIDREFVDKIIHFLRADTKEFFDVLLNVLDHAIQIKNEELVGSTDGSEEMGDTHFKGSSLNSIESQNRSGVKRSRSYSEAGQTYLKRSSLGEELYHSTKSKPSAVDCDEITNRGKSNYEDPLSRKVLGADLVSTGEVAYITKDKLNVWMKKVLDESITSAQVELGRETKRKDRVNRNEALGFAANSVMKQIILK